MTPEALEAMKTEFERVRALHRRSMKLAAAARQLRMAASTVGLMAKKGELEVDPETDSSGARFVTRSSVEAAWMARHGRRNPTTAPAAVPVAEVSRFTGHTSAALVDLVKAGVLQQVPGRRQFLLTAANLRAWMAEDGLGHTEPDSVAGGSAS